MFGNYLKYDNVQIFFWRAIVEVEEKLVAYKVTAEEYEDESEFKFMF